MGYIVYCGKTVAGSLCKENGVEGGGLVFSLRENFHVCFRLFMLCVVYINGSRRGKINVNNVIGLNCEAWEVLTKRDAFLESYPRR